jgi:dihydroflavonol-4-reductase
VSQRVAPLWLLRGLLPGFRAVARVSGTAPLLTEESLRALTDSNPFVRSTRAEQDLGYARRPFEETVADTIAWFRQAGRLA